MRGAFLPALFALLLAACHHGGAETHPAASGGETATSAVGVDSAAPEPSSDDGAGGPPTSCEGVVCEPGQHCEVVEVQCIRAPCPPLAQCVAGPAAR
ncbi:MAG: hypothetical protein U0230_12505 [Polyangiales bacterium]